jgi:hypothetical protein
MPGRRRTRNEGIRPGSLEWRIVAANTACVLSLHLEGLRGMLIAVVADAKTFVDGLGCYRVPEKASASV